MGHMTLDEWFARALRDLGEDLPAGDGEDAALAYADRLFANEEALGRLVRINASDYASVTLHDDEGSAHVIEPGKEGIALSGDVLYLVSNKQA